jgi:NADPH:quinone reductase-like Zn-dependent oxidoreductase
MVLCEQPAFVDALAPGEVEIQLRAVGLNFRDVLLVLGEYPGPPEPPGR